MGRSMLPHLLGGGNPHRHATWWTTKKYSSGNELYGKRKYTSRNELYGNRKSFPRNGNWGRGSDLRDRRKLIRGRQHSHYVPWVSSKAPNDVAWSSRRRAVYTGQWSLAGNTMSARILHTSALIVLWHNDRGVLALIIKK